MTMKQADFSLTPHGRAVFETLWDAISLGASDGQPKTRDRRALIARLQRKLLAISAFSLEADPRFRPLNARSLCKEESVTFSGTELDTIKDLIDKVGWHGTQILAVADLDDFLGGLPDAPQEGQQS